MDENKEGNIDPSVALYIERKARKEADRAGSEAKRMMAVLGTVIIVGAALGIWGLIGQIVTAQLEESGYREIQEQATKGRDLILKHLAAAEQIHTEWENKPAIEVGRYRLQVPVKHGSSTYNTMVNTDHFAASAISGFHMYGNGKPCEYGDNVKVQTIREKGTWHIRIQKEEGCSLVDVTVVFFPNVWVREIHDRMKLTQKK